MSGRGLTCILIPALDYVEGQFSIKNALQWMASYWTISVYASIIYLLLVYFGRRWMKNRPAYSLRQPLILWNIGLALFSFLGMSSLTPNLLKNIYNHGLGYTTCHSDCVSEDHRPLAVWGWIFAMSKLIEFGDTAFIVLRKSPLPFLHWYHHITVFIYTWYALTPEPSALSTWFGSMNYIVHTAMYTYYAFRASGYKIHSSVAKVITVMQLSQMFLGIFVTVLSWYQSKSDKNCMFRYDLFYLASAMYTSYAILFLNFFYHRYIKKPAAASNASANGTVKAKQS